MSISRWFKKRKARGKKAYRSSYDYEVKKARRFRRRYGSIYKD